MKKFLIIVAVLIAAVVIYGLILPTSYDISVSRVIAAQPAAIHAHVEDMEKWSAWMPWQEQDDSVRVQLGDKQKGVGASQTFTSDDGDGEITITKSDPATGIDYDIAFIQDDQRMPAKSGLRYHEVEGGTEVTWWMNGDVAGMPPVLGQYVLKFAMLPAIEQSFARGLENLDRAVTSDPLTPKESNK